MPYIPPETIEQVRKLELLPYLQANEPHELVRLSEGSYCTKTHDSLKISNGKWFWWSRGFGGVSALDYLVKVREIPFLDAVQMITGAMVIDYKPVPTIQEEKPKQLILPPRHMNADRVRKYLHSRGIDKHIIDDCIASGIIYESAGYHNAVFVGKDETGIEKYASLRGTLGDFRIDAEGSDKRYSFRLSAGNGALHLFESAIDVLSYATLLKQRGVDYKNHSLLSLSGVYQKKKAVSDYKIPIALAAYLEANPKTQKIYLHLDNDKTGRMCSEMLKQKLNKDYEIVDKPPPSGKDVNDFLMFKLGRTKTSPERRNCR